MEDYIVKMTGKLSKEEHIQVDGILQENHARNGGTLHMGFVFDTGLNILVTDKKDNVVGYILLCNNYMNKNDVYITQIAVKKSMQGKGLASKMYEFLKKNSKPYSFITAHVRSDNAASLALHKSQGFENVGNCLAVDLEKIKNRNDVKVGAQETFDLASREKPSIPDNSDPNYNYGMQ